MRESRDPAIPSAVICVNSEHFTSYLSGYITFIRHMLLKFKPRKDASALTGVMILAYLLSSIFHPPPTSFYTTATQSTQTTPIRQFLRAYRCNKNDLLPFLPNVFRFDGLGELHCDVVFDTATLKSFFPGYKPLQLRGPVNGLFSNPTKDAEIREDLKRILPDNNARPMPLFNVKFNDKYVSTSPQSGKYVEDFVALIREHGFDSHYTVREFTRMVFAEYYSNLPAEKYVDSTAKPSIHYLSERNKTARDSQNVFAEKIYINNLRSSGLQYMDQRLFGLVPLFGSKVTDKTYETQLSLTGVGILGLRSFWIQLQRHTTRATNPQITYHQMKVFYLKFLSLVFFYTDIIPIVRRDGVLFRTISQPNGDSPRGACEYRKTMLEQHYTSEQIQQKASYVIDPNTDMFKFAIGTRSCPPVFKGIYKR